MNNFNSQVYYWAHMLDEAFDKSRFLCEDKEGKNINRAEKWIKDNHPEVIGQTLQDGTKITPRILTQEIRNTMPNVRMADCKFLVGITRLYFENQDKREEIQSIFSSLNKMLKIICTAHADEYDNNLNGLSYEQLDEKFSGAVQKDLDNDKEEIGRLQLIKQEDYQIVSIDSFEEAKKYGQYTSWCVTHYENMYDSYTKGGLGRFYFCLKPGFEKVQEIKGEGCPLDEYGKSMIAISVNDDGSLNTCTCRWNHANGGNDNIMDTKQISEFFGLNFYKTFVPYSLERLLEKYESMKTDEQDEFAQTLGFIECTDKENDAIFYVKIENGKLVKAYKVVENIVDINGYLYSMQNGRLVKGCPNEVDESFYLTNTQITSLEGAPKEVDGNFDCSDTKITSLNGAPQKVWWDFMCVNTQITSLEGAPKEVDGNFNCSDTKITSLNGAPQEVGGNFNCSGTKITSLEGAPKEVGGSFKCSYTSITSLEGAPQKIGGYFDCSDTNITSLEGAPAEVGGSFGCSYTNITSLEGAPQKINGDFMCYNTKISSLEGAPVEVGRDFICSNTNIISLNGAPQKVRGHFKCSYTKITQKQKHAYLDFLEHPTPEHIDETGHYKE